MRIGTINGSLSSESINATLVRALTMLIGERADVISVPIGCLPLYNRDLDADYPASAAAFKMRLRTLDALIIATPEYDRTMPAALKNAFEWGSRPYGENAFAGIPAGVVGASTGAIGTAAAQQHVRNVLAFLDAPTLGQPEVYLRFDPHSFAPDGTITNDSTRHFLTSWVDRFLAHIERHSATERPES